MASVYSGVYNLPFVARPSASLVLTSSIVYTGGLVYLAYEYSGSTYTAVGAAYDVKTSIPGG